MYLTRHCPQLFHRQIKRNDAFMSKTQFSTRPRRFFLDMENGKLKIVPAAMASPSTHAGMSRPIETFSDYTSSTGHRSLTHALRLELTHRELCDRDLRHNATSRPKQHTYLQNGTMSGRLAERCPRMHDCQRMHDDWQNVAQEWLMNLHDFSRNEIQILLILPVQSCNHLTRFT